MSSCAYGRAKHAFCAPIRALRPRLRNAQCCASRPYTLRRPTCAATRDLYADIGLPGADASTPLGTLKTAYRTHVRKLHPDSEATSAETRATSEEGSDSDDEFARAAGAWAVLSDAGRRATYDALGWAGVAALASVEARGARARAMGLDALGSDADAVALSLDADASLLSPVAEELSAPEGAGVHDDACPRSIAEALWNIEHHSDTPTRYYGLWWVYRFRVVEAAPALQRIVAARGEKTALRRRAALALGVVAAPPAPTGDDAHASITLANALEEPDYYLRYRAAEALATIARRYARTPDVKFPPAVLDALLRILEAGRDRLERVREARSGYVRQEGLFNLDALEPAVREKLTAVFEARRQNERRARRTTMTPQLGVDEVDAEVDQPYEWVLKAAGAIAELGGDTQRVINVAKSFVDHEIPLVRYAAHKTLFALTGVEEHAQVLVNALDYGIEHHYSQRVLIRDLGDLGYAAGAEAMAECPMVENSFKVLALKNMLVKLDNDPSRPDVRNVLKHMDSLL